MSFGEALKVGFRKSFDYNGRASQREFWWFYLWMLIIQMVVSTIFVILISVAFIAAGLAAGASPNEGAVIGVFGVSIMLYALFFLVIIALSLPMYAATARRLHDTGQTGWFVLLNLAGLGIVTLVMCIFEGQPFENQWGPVPEK